jgi:hypothetical protein
MLKSSSFFHDGKIYEIRAGTIDNEIKVRLFEKDQLASPVFYSETIEAAFDAKMRAFRLDLVDELMRLMEHDTISGRLRLFQKSN